MEMDVISGRLSDALRIPPLNSNVGNSETAKLIKLQSPKRKVRALRALAEYATSGHWRSSISRSLFLLGSRV